MPIAENDQDSQETPEDARIDSADPLLQLEGRASTSSARAERAGTLADQVNRQEADDRSWIAKRIIGIFTGVVGGVLAILALGGIKTGEWAAAGNQAVDLIKSAVLPVVTLVLGYYFGRSGKG